MATIADIQEELDQTKELRFVANALTEVSAAKIVRIRQEFEINRQFFEEIDRIYDILKQSLPDRLNLKNIPLVTQQKKPLLAICITPNMRFYGSIPGDVAQYFMDITGPIGADRLVIGQSGIDILQHSHFRGTFEKFICKRDIPRGDEIAALLQRSNAYVKVLVFMPKFQTLMRQNAGVIDITHAKPEGEVRRGRTIDTLFEPELPRIISFFEGQLRTILFNRAILEAELSLTASRLIAMNAAEERAGKELSAKKIQLTMAKRERMNRQLLESFAGFLVAKEER